MQIKSSITKRGFYIKVEDCKFYLDYPEKVWGAYPDYMKKVLRDNVVFLLTMDLPVIAKKKKIHYNTNYPMFAPLLQRCILSDIPDTATNAKKSVHKAVRDFLNIDYEFDNYHARYPKYNEAMEDNSLIPMSFGKDSLLSYALAKETGINPELVTVRETGSRKENIERAKLIRKFTKEFDSDVWQLRNEFAGVHPSIQYLEDEPRWWIFGLSLVEYALELLPFCNKLKTKYIIFGNEQSCNDFFYTKEGFKCSAVADQSHKFMKFYDTITKIMTNNQVSCISLIEPLNEIAITRILHKRYPEIGKYQMSCFPDDHGKTRQRWCCNCSKCARMYVFLKANNIDVKKLGFTANMFHKSSKGYYSIFSKAKKNMVGYDSSESNKEELKFAFYLAYRQGHKGYLIDLFKKKYLDEIKNKEDYYYKKFFGIYDSITMPKEIKNRIMAILGEELGDLA